MQVSVVMAVYNNNSIQILTDAVKSILQQTFKNFEFIICDDASTDNTYEILCDIAKMDNRICLIRNKKNLKAGGARDECLRIARGEYIAIMDSDDISHPKRLEKELKFLEEHEEFDFVGSQGAYFSGSVENIIGHYWFCKEPQKEDFLMTLPFVHASLMFRKSALYDEQGYDMDKRNVRAEDYELLMRLYAKGYKGANLDEVLYYIRLDKNTYKRRSYRFRFFECSLKYKYFKKFGLMPKAMPYVIKPLVVGLMPRFILDEMKRKYYDDKTI